jgi:hypothetical protein
MSGTSSPEPCTGGTTPREQPAIDPVVGTVGKGSPRLTTTKGSINGRQQVIQRQRTRLRPDQHTE